MKKLLLFRHGEVAACHSRRFIGWTDAKLSPEGRRDCTRFEGKFIPDRIFVSPLVRAQESAELIFPEYRDRFIPDSRIMEINFGRYEDLTFDEIAAVAAPEWLRTWSETPEDIQFPCGESFRGFMARVDAFVDSLPDGVNAAVTHGGVIMHILGKLYGLPPSRYWEVLPDRGSVTELELP